MVLEDHQRPAGPALGANAPRPLPSPSAQCLPAAAHRHQPGAGHASASIGRPWPTCWPPRPPDHPSVSMCWPWRQLCCLPALGVEPRARLEPATFYGRLVSSSSKSRDLQSQPQCARTRSQKCTNGLTRVKSTHKEAPGASGCPRWALFASQQAAARFLALCLRSGNDQKTR